MAQYPSQEKIPEIDTSLAQKVQGSNKMIGSPHGTMQDIELSSRKVPVEGVFGWLKPWVGICDREFADRCTSSAFSYLCLNLACTRYLNASISDVQARFSNLLSSLGMPYLFPEESLDVSTASVGANHTRRNDNGGQKFSFNGRNSYGGGRNETEMSASTEGYTDEVDVGVIQEYCNRSHHSFVTLRRMWNEPDLYGFFWINVFVGGYLFVLYALCRQDYGRLEDVVGLDVLLMFVTISWLCSLSIGGVIAGCRTVVAGYFDRGVLVPALCLSGYLQLPLLILAHMVHWKGILEYYIPLMGPIMTLLEVAAFLHLCISTVSAVVLYLPAMQDRNQDMKLKVSSAVSAFGVQLLFFFWIESLM